MFFVFVLFRFAEQNKYKNFLDTSLLYYISIKI